MLTYDPYNFDETQETKAARDRLIGLGWSLIDEGFNYVTLNPPAQPANKGCLRILTDNGDDLVVWDRHDLEEIREAKQRFDACIAKGYKAYAMKSRGEKGVPLDQFDPLLEHIILTPSTRPG